VLVAFLHEVRGAGVGRAAPHARVGGIAGLSALSALWFAVIGHQWS
jgi:hypothetical protein